MELKTMKKSEIFDKMLRCNGAMLDILTMKLDLDPGVLPGRGEAIATRASEILKQAEAQDLLTELEEAISKIIPQRPVQPKHPQPAELERILIFAANPLETDRLVLDEEVRLIKERLQESDPGRKYRVESEWAVRPTELAKFLMQHEPKIVHFSGHGSPTGDIVLQGENRMPQVVSPVVLANLFEILKGSTECVVLNACYSLEQAGSLANYVGCVVGMDRAIGDASALRFAAGFYRGLAFGKDYQTAYRLGCNEIDIASLVLVTTRASADPFDSPKQVIVRKVVNCVNSLAHWPIIANL
jgi:hypothetical protein